MDPHFSGCDKSMLQVNFISQNTNSLSQLASQNHATLKNLSLFGSFVDKVEGKKMDTELLYHEKTHNHTEMLFPKGIDEYNNNLKP